MFMIVMFEMKKVEFCSTVPSKNFDLCIIPTRTKTHKPSNKKYMYHETAAKYNEILNKYSKPCFYM